MDVEGLDQTGVTKNTEGGVEPRRGGRCREEEEERCGTTGRGEPAL